MKSNTIFRVLLVLLGLAFSPFLAGGGDGYSIPTPGVLAARVLHRRVHTQTSCRASVRALGCRSLSTGFSGSQSCTRPISS